MKDSGICNWSRKRATFQIFENSHVEEDMYLNWILTKNPQTTTQLHSSHALVK